MNIADKIRANQDDAATLRRALERIIQLYTDKAHFVYELLQNAEDSGASNIKFDQFPDRLEVFHNGRPFTENNLNSLCDVGLSDKEKDLNKIGEFGVGFKSVFSICDVVRLYSEPDHYNGELNEEVEPFAVEIRDFTRPYSVNRIELDANYTTKFVFPFHAGESYSGFSDLQALRTTLADKLKGLDITTLLFMKNLQEIEYNIHGASTVSGTYLLDTTRISDKCLLISAIGENSRLGSGTSKDETVSYLKFSRQLKNSPRSVDIAFAVKDNGNNQFTCVKSTSPFISVYFPTGTESKVDFVVQGPFRTTPDRSSIPPADPDNILFAKELATLLKDSLEELKRLKILNTSFIQCLPIDKHKFDFVKLLYPLYEITEITLKYNQLLPAKNGTYISAAEAKLTDSKQIAVIFTDEILTELIDDRQKYFWLPTDITDSNNEYRELFYYLSNVLSIGVIRPESLRIMFNNNEAFLYNRSEDWLVELYGFFMTIRAQFNRDGKASLVFSKIVKTDKGKFTAPYRLSEEKKVLPNIFLPSKKSVWKDIDFVDESLYKRCKPFFEELLVLKEPDEYQSFIEYVNKTYGNGSFPEDTHIDDIKHFIKYMNHPDYGAEVCALIKGCILLKCRNSNGPALVNPYNNMVYLPNAPDGTKIEQYYINVIDNYYVDVDYYMSHGIETETLLAFNIYSSIIKGDGQKSGYSDYDHDGRFISWNSYSEYSPLFDIDGIKSVLVYISKNSKTTDAIQKSKIIFDILKKNENKLSGVLYVSRNENRDNDCCTVVKILKGDIYSSDWNGKWLYTSELELVSQKGISKRALNVDLYGQIDYDSELYEILGFKKTPEDEMDLSEKEYDLLTGDKQRDFLEIALRRNYNISTDELKQIIRESSVRTAVPRDITYDFPSQSVKNWDTLKKHVTQMFAWAVPVKYEDVVRRIRTSKHTEDARSYLLNVYKYDGANKCACQMCHKPIASFVNATQLFDNPEHELDPLHLCLCAECHDTYSLMRKNSDLMVDLYNELYTIDNTFISSCDPVKIRIGEKELWFTQIHIAEINELLKLAQTVKDCIDGTKEEKEKAGDHEAVDLFVMSINEKYRALVGKRVRHKGRGETGVVQAFDEGPASDYLQKSYLRVLMETGRDKGSVLSFSIQILEQKAFLEVIDV